MENEGHIIPLGLLSITLVLYEVAYHDLFKNENTTKYTLLTSS